MEGWTISIYDNQVLIKNIPAKTFASAEKFAKIEAKKRENINFLVFLEYENTKYNQKFYYSPRGDHSPTPINWGFVPDTESINHYSKVGWGYSTKTIKGADGNLIVERPTQPTHIGSVVQVLNAIANDLEYQSLRGKIQHETAWFVRASSVASSVKTWREFIQDDEHESVGDLILRLEDVLDPDDFIRRYQYEHPGSSLGDYWKKRVMVELV